MIPSQEETLEALAELIKQSADNEDWDTLGIQLAQFQRKTLQQHFTKSDRPTLTRCQQLIEQAIFLAKQRQDQIGTLIGNLSGTAEQMK